MAKQNDGISDEDALLNELILNSRIDPPDGFERPDQNSIMAYLTGTASGDQRQRVQEAMADSKIFRDEIRAMAEDLATIGEPDASLNKEIIPEVIPPERREFLAKSGKIPPSFIEKRPDPFSESESIWSKLIRLRIPQLVAPTLAVAAIVLIIFWPPHRGTISPHYKEWVEVSRGIEAAYLISSTTREAFSPGSRTVFPNPHDAALGEIRLLLKFDRGRFSLNPVEFHDESPSQSREIVLKFIDYKKTVVSEFKTNIPATGVGLAGSVTAWVLTLPSRDLFSVEMTYDTIAAPWISEMGSMGCVTFTYPVGDGYQAVMGYTFDFP